MSWETARENRSQIQEFVESLLLDDDRHKLWRKLAISERGVGKGLIGEILGTPHGPVFVSRMTMDDERATETRNPTVARADCAGSSRLQATQTRVSIWPRGGHSSWWMRVVCLRTFRPGSATSCCGQDIHRRDRRGERPRSRSLTGGHELRSIAPNTSNGTSCVGSSRLCARAATRSAPHRRNAPCLARATPKVVLRCPKHPRS